MVKQVLIVRQKITSALDRDQLMEADHWKKELSQLKKELFTHKVCALCWMPVPGEYSAASIPEKWYFDAVAARCAYCGKDCALPLPDGVDKEHQTRSITSLTYRVRSEMTLACKHFVSKFQKYKEYKKSIPELGTALGQGKGVRLRSDVPVAILVGCLHRTLQRISLEEDLAELAALLVSTLTFLGFY